MRVNESFGTDLFIFPTGWEPGNRRSAGSACFAVICGAFGSHWKDVLEEAIDVHPKAERIARLMMRHRLDRSTATQIVQNRISLDKYLHSRRRKAHLKKYCNRSILEVARGDGRPRIFSFHGKEVFVARIKKVHAYEVELVRLGADLKPDRDPELIHKLEFKFGGRFDHAAKLQSAMSTCESGSAVAKPILRPQDRYPISDKKLFGWVDAKTDICVNTLEGDVVKGGLSWIGRWEIGLDVQGVELVVFRHALANIQGIRWGSSKAD